MGLGKKEKKTENMKYAQFESLSSAKFDAYKILYTSPHTHASCFDYFDFAGKMYGKPHIHTCPPSFWWIECYCVDGTLSKKCAIASGTFKEHQHFATSCNPACNPAASAVASEGPAHQSWLMTYGSWLILANTIYIMSKYLLVTSSRKWWEGQYAGMGRT